MGTCMIGVPAVNMAPSATDLRPNVSIMPKTMPIDFHEITDTYVMQTGTTTTYRRTVSHTVTCHPRCGSVWKITDENLRTRIESARRAGCTVLLD